jgi:hypothetical protein
VKVKVSRIAMICWVVEGFLVVVLFSFLLP